MKHAITLSLVGIMLLLCAVPADAAKRTTSLGVPFGNGFPKGNHFNLNIIAKRDNFVCPEPVYDPCTGKQIYGNVIFIPRDQGTDPITILMESGTKMSKRFPGLSVLQVTDWCTESFPDNGSGNGDNAIVRLPANDRGYAVYARITGKPGEDGEPNVTITPGLAYVRDEAGNDLLLLGLVDRQGISRFASNGQTIYRTSLVATTTGKGVQKATNVTALFEWTGEVCYVQSDVNDYCWDEFSQFICSSYNLCCVDANSDGVYEYCEPNLTGCLQGYLPVTAYCRSYENEWIFNIGDFVGYLWDIDSTGAYVIQVRFYPL